MENLVSQIIGYFQEFLNFNLDTFIAPVNYFISHLLMPFMIFFGAPKINQSFTNRINLNKSTYECLRAWDDPRFCDVRSRLIIISRELSWRSKVSICPNTFEIQCSEEYTDRLIEKIYSDEGDLSAALSVLNFFDSLSNSYYFGWVDKELIYERYHLALFQYHGFLKPLIQERRESAECEDIYSELEKLYRDWFKKWNKEEHKGLDSIYL